MATKGGRAGRWTSYSEIEWAETLQRAREACANLKPLSHPMSSDELAQRARIIEMVQTLQGRADDLGEALERFKVRREAMRA